MCFSEEMSLGMSILGLVATFVLFQMKKSWRVYVPIFYFTLMEILQYFSYIALRKKQPKLLKILSILIYIHIAFQPFIANLWFSNYIPQSYAPKMAVILQLCIIIGFFLLLRLNEIIAVPDDKLCNIRLESMCDTETLIREGRSHLHYLFRVRAPDYTIPSIFVHFFFMFIPAILLKIKLIPYLSIVFGYLLANLLAFPKEVAAVWCTISVPSMLVSLFY